MAKKLLEISGKPVPVEDLANYANHLRGAPIIAKRMGLEAYDQERTRLHNKIFNAAGFKDTRWGNARQTAYFFASMNTFRDAAMREEAGYDQNLVDFNEALDEVIGKLLE